MKLKEMIDLEYLVEMDESFESKKGIQALITRDRKIFEQCSGACRTEKDLLLSWLKERKNQLSHEDSQKGLTFPGSLYERLFRALSWVLILTGFAAGAGIAYSFLGYHGVEPVNVALFAAVFICLPFLLSVFSAVIAALNLLGIKESGRWFQGWIVQPLLASVFFKIIPAVMNKLKGRMTDAGRNIMDQAAFLAQLKGRGYGDIFFWLFFVMGSLFAVFFSAGVLAGTFFRVLVTDLAFGWQSTILTSETTVFNIVSFMAFPWSGWLPEAIAYPGLEQIAGSRIILKDGISVLATQDLVSWWPFVCLAILFYTFLPRLILLITAFAGQGQAMNKLDFSTPEMRQLLARMRSGILSVSDRETPVSSTGIKKEPKYRKDEEVVFNPAVQGQPAVVLADRTAYPRDVLARVVRILESRMFYNVKKVLEIDINTDAAVERVRDAQITSEDQVIWLQEAWQPPIRGILYSLDRIKKVLPGATGLMILLTRDTGEKEPAPAADDPDIETWENAIQNLNDPGIKTKRLAAP